MNLNHLLHLARTGDIVATISSVWVRVLTAESFSHVGIILREGEKVFVVETHENINDTRKIPIEKWVQKYSNIYLGVPDYQIQKNRHKVKQGIYDYLALPVPKKKYGYLTLPLVWLNQLFPKIKMQHKLNVCSTFVGEMWRKAGWKNGKHDKLADPGDIALACLILYKYTD